MNENAKRTSAGLRELLFEMIDGVKAGTVDDKTARTIATLAASVLKSVEVELQFRAQVMRGQVSALEMGDLPLAALPEPAKEKGVKMGGAIVASPNPRFVRGRAQSASN